jgi:hypothetical protein
MTEVLQPGDQEIKSAREQAAVFANKFIVTIGPTVRISFMEQYGAGAPAYPRAAIAMVHEDAIALKNLLVELLKELEVQIAEAKKSASRPGSHAR